MGKLSDLGVEEVINGLSNKSFSAKELVQAYIDKILEDKILNYFHKKN